MEVKWLIINVSAHELKLDARCALIIVMAMLIKLTHRKVLFVALMANVAGEQKHMRIGVIRVVKVVEVEEDNLLRVVTVEEEEVTPASWWNPFSKESIEDAWWTKYVTTSGYTWHHYPSMHKIEDVKHLDALNKALEQFELQTLFNVNEYGEHSGA